MLNFSTHAECQHTCWNSARMLKISTHAENQHTCWKSARVLKFSTHAENQHVCWNSARMLNSSTHAKFQHVCWNSACVLNFSMCADIQHVCWNSVCTQLINKKPTRKWRLKQPCPSLVQGPGIKPKDPIGSVASIPMGLGGSCPPPLFGNPQKVRLFYLSLCKNCCGFSICPATFLENDAPVLIAHHILQNEGELLAEAIQFLHVSCFGCLVFYFFFIFWLWTTGRCC